MNPNYFSLHMVSLLPTESHADMRKDGGSSSDASNVKPSRKSAR
jgi:hypothetical protein